MLHYQVTVADPKGHYFDVQLQFEIAPSQLQGTADKRWIDLSLPTWIPGSYMIREFSRNVMYVRARAGSVQTECMRERKDTWRVHVDSKLVNDVAQPLLIQCEWRVYAWDLSVRSAHLDETHGFFNGTSVFLCPQGFEEQAIELTISRPGENLPDWQIACGLNNQPGTLKDQHGCPVLRAGGMVKFEAANFDNLIDHPVEMGALQVQSFNAHGVEHVFAVYGADADLDLQRICDDLKPVCEAQIALFEPATKQAPFERYVFMLHATDNGYGGLEHRNSTALLFNANELPQRDVEKAPKGYEGFLGLCSHEYFHSWNVKRMKPAAFVPYDLTQENYTRLLWIFEGFTSYYDDVMLARVGKMTEEAYLKSVGRNIAQVMKGPGRLNQSVTDSSFDAWTKYYRQDENAPNSIVSYYTKGSLVALCIDSAIRRQTAGQKSLDDVMRLMWQKKGLSGEGLQEDEFSHLVQEATGIDLSQEIAQWTQTTDELPLGEALRAYGFELSAAKSEEQIYLGLHGQFKPEGMLVKQVINGSAAHAAGVSAGDVLVALAGKKLTETNYKRLLAAGEPGAELRAVGFRAERLMEFDLIAGKPVSNDWTIKKPEQIAGTTVPAPWIQ
ncbi:MAG: peptidase M61 [Burkholderiales bacterium]|jgi:predicted metalloprotease with PDZ domain|uniref:M61 family metallopeptidase n=1 Tax=Limnobacter sp. TaxID=2003368 RepID=UPI0039BCD1D1|nr:peptidase M61 [Burkholderiales bacterium]